MASPLPQFWWDTTRLTSAVKSANLSSFEAAAADAKLRRHNTSKSDVNLKVIDAEHAQLQPEGLQGLFELGGKGPYPINASGVGTASSTGRVTTVVVRGGSGDKGALAGAGLAHPVRGVMRGPQRAFPAMRPAAQGWARAGYSAVARRVLAAFGFGVKL